ncbi:MAG: hypothetical protein WCC90_04545, partial [Methylocella sp.]
MTLLRQLQLQQQVGHQDRDAVRIPCQPLKARRQQHAIAALQLRQARVAQPVVHVSQGVEQVAQLPRYAVAARAQQQVADGPLHAFRLQQRLPRLLQDELLLL